MSEETSVNNLQAREFWKEQHEAEQAEQKQGGSSQPRQPRPKSAVQNYQRTLSSSKSRRRQPNTARPSTVEPDPDDLGPATFVNSAQVRKDHRYYRRKGAIWTDPEVHVPESRQHLLGLRPDLEKKHDDYVQSVVKKEQRAKRQMLNYRARKRYETRELMNQRQEDNLIAEETALNWGREDAMSSANEQSSSRLSRPTTASRTRDGVLKKDWKFYRRQGALWTDLVHLPAERLHFVLRPKIIKMDREATLRIKEKYEEEIDLEYASRETKMRRANKIRNAFVNSTIRRREEAKSQWGREPPYSLGKTGKHNANRERTSSANNNNQQRSRLSELAQPKTASAKRPSTSVGQSYYGLLSADTTVGPLLHEHWGRQGYDIHQSGKINVTDSITSTDEVRVNVSTSTSRSSGISSSNSRGGRMSSHGGRRSNSNNRSRSNNNSRSQRTSTPSNNNNGRATTTRGRQRPPRQQGMNSTKSQRPSTAPTNNAGFTGSQTGGYQGARADPYDSSQRSVRSVTRGGELAETSAQQQAHSTEFAVEMTPAPASVVNGPAQDALEAIMELESFDIKRMEAEKASNGRSENWFAKPYVSSNRRIPRPSTAGALTKPTNYFRDMNVETE